MPPILSQTGVALNRGLDGISAISFGGIIFGGTTKIGGPPKEEAGLDSTLGIGGRDIGV